jgi:hypothetical protein
MKSNPGGQIDIKDILGRDRLIATLWDALEQQSVIMTAERRIGKTSVIRKMQAEPRADWVPVLQDLEGLHSAHDFAVAVYEKVLEHLAGWRKLSHKAKAFFESIGGTEIGGVLTLPKGEKQHWKYLLIHSIEDLVTQQDPKRLVFFWDEMPYMLDNIRSREGEDTAMEVLDVLRSLRQHKAGFRMVLTGSIGLHHVLAALKAADYKNEPFNDMYAVEVTPLAPADGQELARRLIDGEQLKAADTGKAAEAIAEQGDHFPFYVHHIARHLKVTGRTADPDQVVEAVHEQMIAPNDPWELSHYRSRLVDYYPKEEKVVTAILDTLATAAKPVPVDGILAAVKSQTPFDDRNRLLQLLRLLERDHYVGRSPEGHYHFRFPLIRRWWKLDRGL